MKRNFLVIGLAAGIGLLAANSFGDEEKLTTAQAKDHAGQTNTVCGTVADARVVETIKGQPTFLDFDKPHPEKTFSVVIWQHDAKKFSEPPVKTYAGKRICVTGLIELHKGIPQIEVKDPSQITIPADEPAAAEPAAEPKAVEPKPDEPKQ